ncbi:hypothetical protein PV05_00319 [Exophiala xenobiotica]|uniref:Uncharacterized protein n=1 Tax=Exophiala xenobiotica TaxID=348802 RepID=A0A0D2FIV8_9EURO|nr:uncharacterized protein PV05_00319 [Exophiala xenobiotica]KIW60074.1 hypothetical protein PV05_00319 [Exophiala xenobiotica]
MNVISLDAGKGHHARSAGISRETRLHLLGGNIGRPLGTRSSASPFPFPSPHPEFTQPRNRNKHGKKVWPERESTQQLALALTPPPFMLFQSSTPSPVRLRVTEYQRSAHLCSLHNSSSKETPRNCKKEQKRRSRPDAC